MDHCSKSSVTSSLAVDQTPGEVKHDEVKLTAQYLIRQGFHPHPLICLYEVPEKSCVSTAPINAIRGKPWLIRTGYIGSDPICQLTLKDQKLRNKHSRIKFNTKTDRYVMLDNDTPQGTCLLLSVARCCREKVRLQEHDIIEVGSRIKVKSGTSAKSRTTANNNGRHTTVKLKVTSIQVTQNTKILQRYRELDRRRNEQRETEFLRKKQDTMRNLASDFDLAATLEDDELERLEECVAAITPQQKMASALLTPEEIKVKQATTKHKVKFGSMPKNQPTVHHQLQNFELLDNDNQVYKGKAKYLAPWQKLERRFTKNAESFTITVILTIVQGPPDLKGKRYTVVDDDITIGSSYSNTVCLPNIVGVSPIHAKIVRDGRELWLQDLSIGNPFGTRLHLKQRRGVSILPRDIFCIGSKIQLGATEVSGFPNGTENWMDVAVKVYRTRKSTRCNKVPEKDEVFQPRYFLFGDKEELTIGRRVQDCQVSMRDYDMPAFAAMISLFQNRFFIESISESKKKGVFRLIGRGDIDEEALSVRDFVTKDGTMLTALSSSRGPPHHLREGDTFKMGRSLFKVIEIHVETRKECIAKTAKAAEELSKISMFSSLHQSDLALVAQAMSIQSFSNGQRIVQQGERSYRLYIIRTGSVVVSHDHVEEDLAVLGPGDHFGEMSLLSGVTNATCRAQGETNCLVLDSLSAKSLLSAESLEIVRIFAEQRMCDGIFHDLQQCVPFNNFNTTQQRVLASRMKVTQYNPGDLVFPKDATVGKLIFVTFGAVSMTGRGNNGATMSQIADDEQVKGPMSLLCETEIVYRLDQESFKSDSDAVAIAPTTCIAIDIPILHDILKRSDEELEEELKLKEEHTKATMLAKRLNLETRNVTGIKSRDAQQQNHSGPGNHPVDLSNHAFMRTQSRAYKTEIEKASATLGEGEEGNILMGTTEDETITVTEGFKDKVIEEDSEAELLEANSDDASSQASSEVSSEASAFTYESGRSGHDEAPGYYHNARDIAEANEKVAHDLVDKPYYIILKALSGPLRKSRLILHTPITVFGRCVGEDDPRNKARGDLVRFVSINDRTLSPENSMIEYRSGAFYLCDMQSKFGTFFKLLPGKEYTLEPGDVFECSQHEFQILAQMEASFGSNSACCDIA